MSDTASTTSNTAQQGAPKSPPEWLAEKFWDSERGEVRVEALAKSYNELERRLGLGEAVPASPDDYDLELDDLLDVDADVNKRLHDAGFSNTQAQLVYDLARERLVPLVQSVSAADDDTRQMQQLVDHFGGADAFQAVRDQLRAWGQANLPNDVFQTLAGSVEGVIAMHAMMQSGEPGLGAPTASAGALGERDLKRLMADPRYWRDRDPAVVEQVRTGFRRLYPEG